METSEQHKSHGEFRFGIEPSAFRVGSITKRVRELGKGVHKVADHNGVTLWAHIVDGRGVDFRAFDKTGAEIGVVIFTPPDPRLDHPEAQALRPRKKGVLYQGGSAGCPYVCACLGDGGYICWQQC